MFLSALHYYSLSQLVSSRCIEPTMLSQTHPWFQSKEPHFLTLKVSTLNSCRGFGVHLRCSSSFSLLKEAEFHAEQREYELNRRRQLGLSSSHHSLDNTDFDNKDDDKHDQRLLSQFGIWFLVGMLSSLSFRVKF